jgi:hypothetical protein
MEDITLTLVLTKEQYMLLEDTLCHHLDDGPDYAGWQSTELQALSVLVKAAFDSAKGAKEAWIN